MSRFRVLRDSHRLSRSIAFGPSRGDKAEATTRLDWKLTSPAGRDTLFGTP
jgi:hypothetical protein